MDDHDSHFWVATAPIGAVSVLAEELAVFGATHIKERSTDVRFQGPLEVGYRACLWSRTATRVLLSLGSVDAAASQSIYEGAKRIDWREHFLPGATLACDCTGANDAIKHTVYGAQLLKDAVCDSLRDSTGARPDVRPERPDVRLHLHVEGSHALISIDFSGESLHRRGYRSEGGRAPLKENVAAAILLRAGWPGIADQGGSLVDPMCGSGTFLTEAALIAADAAPGLERDYFGFSGWRGFDAQLWERLCEEAQTRRAARPVRRCITGYDTDADSVRMSLANAASAGVADWIHVEKRDIMNATVINGAAPAAGAPAAAGLLVANPPYGERIGDDAVLPGVYAALGRLMRENFKGWQAAVLTGNPPLARHLGVYAKRSHRFMNGAIECRLLRFDLSAAAPVKSAETVLADRIQRPGARMFANRLNKNLQRFQAWALKNDIEAYRVYDADMPEYSFAIDSYGRDPKHVYVQEYEAPKSVDQNKARDRRREVLSVLPEVFGVPLYQIHTRVRRLQKGSSQYQPEAAGGRPTGARRFLVREGGLKFWVNFDDYLDTGLFLDHRMTRSRIRDLAGGADFLNLFCYTASATVYAAGGGAHHSVSVDLSNTYLQWARDNLEANGFDRNQHELHAADCLQWLEERVADGPAFDLIFLDPPTFSNSKRMEGVLDVQRDHPGMIRRTMQLLRAPGTLIFSTNYTRFKLDADLSRDFQVEDISAATIPVDFERNPKIHRCYVIRHGQT
jgi:23S rRNA (guanine2445-N2)-methyltransferase / 23S rRNA (guanine2069-N7)-methyltransferase